MTDFNQGNLKILCTIKISDNPFSRSYRLFLRFQSIRFPREGEDRHYFKLAAIDAIDLAINLLIQIFSLLHFA
jgi:hypothetical protein